jgi:hypothetical protein
VLAIEDLRRAIIEAVAVSGEHEGCFAALERMGLESEEAGAELAVVLTSTWPELVPDFRDDTGLATIALYSLAMGLLIGAHLGVPVG